MYEDIKTILEYISKQHFFTFPKLFKHFNLQNPEADKIKSQLIELRIVKIYEADGGIPFGPDEEYTISDYGNKLLSGIQEVETMDKILLYLSEHRNSYLSMDEIGKQIGITPSRLIALRMERLGYLDYTEDKSGKSYIISATGEELILSGGNKQQLVDNIDSSLLGIDLIPEPVKKRGESLRDYQGDIDKYYPEKPVTNVTNVHTHTYIHNQDSTVHKQAGTLYEAPVAEVPKKINWLKIIGIVITSLVGITILYTFIKTLL